MNDFCRTCCQDVDAASVAQERLTEIETLRAKLDIAVYALKDYAKRPYPEGTLALEILEQLGDQVGTEK